MARRGSIYRTQTGRDKSRPYNKNFLTLIVFTLNKILAASAFLLQSYAISLGSVTAVNALQGTQYVFLLGLTAVVSLWFPKLFHEYYAIHETIHAILGESNGGQLEVSEVARRVKEKHPDLEMGPATLSAAIKQAVQDTRATVSE